MPVESSFDVSISIMIGSCHNYNVIPLSFATHLLKTYRVVKINAVG